ncbi:MAG: hypothetical protein HY926_15525 [Elusimicrobia bacterium]|nr:hypothetical protein [Elusimicrobiota bacterium]
MCAAWMNLLLLASGVAAEELKAADQRPYAEATPQVFARRARACRADLADYRKRANEELLDRLLLCMEHPDARVRAEVLDELPDRRLWDLPEYEGLITPRFLELAKRFEKDPDWKVRLHAGQVSMWLHNGDRWREWESPAARKRRGLPAEEARNRGGKPWLETPLPWLFVGAYIAFIVWVNWVETWRRKR